MTGKVQPLLVHSMNNSCIKRICGTQRARLVLLLLCCNAVLYVNRANMSVAVTFMYAADQTAERAQVLAAFYAGYPLLQIAAGHLSAQRGGKQVLLTAALLWSIATMAVIPAYFLGPWAVCIARAVVGACEGVNYPAQFALLSKWIPLEERSQALSVLCAGESIGTIGAMFGCAWLAHVAGWEAVFVVSALLAMLWSCAFAFLATSSPEASTRVTLSELSHILMGRGDVDPPGASNRKRVPWKRFLWSRALWAVIVPHICFNWGHYLCLSVLPDYFQTSLHSNPLKTGFFTIIPYLALFLVDNLVGHVADRLFLQRWGWSLVVVRKVCTVIALGGAGMFFLLLGSLPACSASPCPTTSLAVVYVTGAVCIGGFAFSGFQVNFLDISPRYASQLISISNTLASLPGIFGVMTLSWFGGNFTAVFAFAAALEFGGAVWFLALAQAQDQQFDRSCSMCPPGENCRL